MSKIHVLLVDDEPSILNILRYGLEAAGCTVETTDSPFVARARLVRDQLPTVVVVGDIKPLPDVSLKLIYDIQLRFGSRLPVIALSTQVIDQYINLALVFGAERFIGKPFCLDGLIEAVEAIGRRNHAA